MRPLVFPVRHHASLERLVLLDLALTSRTGLHIGAGKSIDLASSDQPVMRDAMGRPLVPGSSLRGILRSGIEGLLGSVGLGDLKPRVPPDAPDPHGLAKSWSDMGLVERLFGRVAEESGGFSYGSRLHVSDATCDADAAFELRDGVAISRESRTASGGAKFDLEVVPAGTGFRGRIRLLNPLDYEVGLVAQGLWLLDEGVLLLGGNVARGLGWMRVEVADPVDLDAAAIFDGASPRQDGELGSVEEKLGAYLEQLRELVRLATADAKKDE